MPVCLCPLCQAFQHLSQCFLALGFLTSFHLTSPLSLPCQIGLLCLTALLCTEQCLLQVKTVCFFLTLRLCLSEEEQFASVYSSIRELVEQHESLLSPAARLVTWVTSYTTLLETLASLLPKSGPCSGHGFGSGSSSSALFSPGSHSGTKFLLAGVVFERIR